VSVVTHLTESFLVFRRLFSDVLECYHKNEKRKTKEPDKPKRKVVKAINQSWSKEGVERFLSSGPTSCFLQLQKEAAYRSMSSVQVLSVG